MARIDDLFDLLDDWRNLPSYQLERRADIFFAVHLEKILENSRSTLVLKNKIIGIIPEFPVLKRIINKDEISNRSFKVDYAVFFENSSKYLLVELKTDMGSIDEKQYKDLKKVQQEVVLSDIVEGIKIVYKKSKSKYRAKYGYLLKQLCNLKIIDNDYNFKIEPSKQNTKNELFYLMPDYDKKKKIIPESGTITFDDVRQGLSEEEDPLTVNFVEALKHWTESGSYTSGAGKKLT
jgi:hypothetical protein